MITEGFFAGRFQEFTAAIRSWTTADLFLFPPATRELVVDHILVFSYYQLFRKALPHT